MKIPVPLWYDKLPRKLRSVIDQAAHVTVWAVVSAIASPVAAVWMSYVYEFFIQWPMERVGDTRLDIGFQLAGLTLGAPLFLLIWF